LAHITGVLWLLQANSPQYALPLIPVTFHAPAPAPQAMNPSPGGQTPGISSD
jgi:hypothetical protein